MTILINFSIVCILSFSRFHSINCLLEFTHVSFRHVITPFFFDNCMKLFAVAWLAVTIQPVFFDAPAEGIVDVAVAFSMVQLFDTYFGQAVYGIVMVILGTAGSLFVRVRPCSL